MKEVEQDAEEFGPGRRVAVWIRSFRGAEFVMNYDLIVDEDPIDAAAECGPDEYLDTMTLSELIIVLDEQTRIPKPRGPDGNK